MEIVQASAPPIPTFKYLDDIIAILGSTKTTLFPLLESADDSREDYRLYSYKENVHNLVAKGDGTEPFYPYRHVGGIHSLSFEIAENQYLLGEDSTDFEFPSNAAFSVGLWILPRDITTVTLLAKYDTNNQREWRLMLNGSSKLELTSYDEANDETRIGPGDTAVSLNEWTFVVATTDGADDDASMNFYLNGEADGSGNAESGSGYASQPGGTAALTIAADLATGAAANEFEGRIALPFVCGKVLTAAEVKSLYPIGQKLLGLA